MVEAVVGARCLNCGAELTGRYCTQCGQKHEPKIHTLGHFFSEAFESITHADSRLWRTIGTLLTEPGVLTREFFAGRRARYLPPVRFYLVVSVLFFFLASVASQDASNIVKIDIEADAAATADKNKNDDNCTNLNYDGPFKEWVQPRLQTQCRKLLADGGRGFAQALFQNLPKALFVLLPLLAALMKLLYWRPPRYYVEHLLFLLHNHIAVFLVNGFLISLDLVLPDSNSVGLLGVAMHVWLLWYIYRGMRAYYGQSRRRSAAKFTVMLLAYVIIAIVTMLITLAISAMML